jgi:hypothetical protein
VECDGIPSAMQTPGLASDMVQSQQMLQAGGPEYREKLMALKDDPELKDVFADIIADHSAHHDGFLGTGFLSVVESLFPFDSKWEPLPFQKSDATGPLNRLAHPPPLRRVRTCPSTSTSLNGSIMHASCTRVAHGWHGVRRISNGSLQCCSVSIAVSFNGAWYDTRRQKHDRQAPTDADRLRKELNLSPAACRLS